MCEANAYLVKDGLEELVMESVDLLEPDEGAGFKLVSIFGEQKILKGQAGPDEPGGPQNSFRSVIRPDRLLSVLFVAVSPFGAGKPRPPVGRIVRTTTSCRLPRRTMRSTNRNQPFLPDLAVSISRSSRRRTLPMADLGNSSMNSYNLGTL